MRYWISVRIAALAARARTLGVTLCHGIEVTMKNTVVGAESIITLRSHKVKTVSAVLPVSKLTIELTNDTLLQFRDLAE